MGAIRTHLRVMAADFAGIASDGFVVVVLFLFVPGSQSLSPVKPTGSTLEHVLAQVVRRQLLTCNDQNTVTQNTMEIGKTALNHSKSSGASE